MKQILAAFDYSSYIEMALSALVPQKLSKSSLAVFPLYNKPYPDRHMPIHEQSQTDLYFILATISGVLGASIGFLLYWGPIIWGILASVAGFFIGYLLELVWIRRRRHKEPQIILVIRCPQEKVDEVCHILWMCQASGLTVTNCQPPSIH
ncbi:MAG: hypothetical protein ABF608_04990 [Sporolactobacillus sp.]